MLASAGLQLVDISPMPGLRAFRDSACVLEPIQPGINAFLAAREELAHLRLTNLPVHELNKLGEVVRNVGEGASDSPRYAQLMGREREWRGKFGAISAENRLDGIIFPIVQCLPPTLEDVYAQRFTTFMLPVNTDIANALQWPAIPIGKTRDVPEDSTASELPVGLDLLGMPLCDVEMVGVGAAIEAALKPV